MLKIPFQFFWNIQNFVLSWKQSVWRKKRHVLGTFQFWPKSPCPVPYRCAHFVGWFFWVDFLNCWKYPSNSSETFKLLFFHQNNQFEEKKACFCGLFNSDQNRCIWTLPAWPFLGWFWVSFEVLKIPFQFLWNIQNFVLSWKQSVWRKKRHVLGTFQFGPKSLYPELTGVAILLVDFLELIFWNVENTLPILLKHSKFCSFMKTISLKKKKGMFWGLFKLDQNRCIRTLPAWPFFGSFWVFFEMLKIPFQFYSNIQYFVLSWKQSVCSKNSMFCGLFNFDQNHCIRTLPAWPFC